MIVLAPKKEMQALPAMLLTGPLARLLHVLRGHCIKVRACILLAACAP